MDSYKAVFVRKAVRAYEAERLDDETIARIVSFGDGVALPFPEARVAFEVVDGSQTKSSLAAPHYVLFSGENVEGAFENIGYLGQRISLFLTTIGIGSCWLGSARPAQNPGSGMPFVMALACGAPAEPLTRTLEEFKRKSLGQIANGTDPRLEAARLAPSGMNMQAWFFDCRDNGGIDVFRKKPFPLLSPILTKSNRVDAGIALCHLAVASEHREIPFRIAIEQGIAKEGYRYVATVEA